MNILLDRPTVRPNTAKDVTQEDLEKVVFPALPANAQHPELNFYAVHLKGTPPNGGYWPAFLIPKFETRVAANIGHPFKMSFEEMRKLPRSMDETKQREYPDYRYLQYEGRDVVVEVRAFQIGTEEPRQGIFCEVPEIAVLYHQSPVDEVRLWCPVRRGKNEGGPGEHGVYDDVCPACTSEKRQSTQRIQLARIALAKRYASHNLEVPEALAQLASIAQVVNS